MKCIVCSQEIEDIAKHIFECAAITHQVAESNKPIQVVGMPLGITQDVPQPVPPIPHEQADKRSAASNAEAHRKNEEEEKRKQQEHAQMRREHPEYFQSWGGHVSKPAENAASTPVASFVPKKQLKGMELDAALMDIEVVAKWLHEKQAFESRPGDLLGPKVAEFIRAMYWRARKYKQDTYITEAQHDYIRKIIKTITDAAMSKEKVV